MIMKAIDLSYFGSHGYVGKDERKEEKERKREREREREYELSTRPRTPCCVRNRKRGAIREPLAYGADDAALANTCVNIVRETPYHR